MAVQVLVSEPIRNVRSNRDASRRRRERTARARYAGLARFCGWLAAALCCVMLYVALVSKLTATSYAVATLERQRATLQVQTAHLEDQLASLRSDERLARIAANLKMTDPSAIAVVSLPAPVSRPHPAHVAFLSTLTALFEPR